MRIGILWFSSSTLATRSATIWRQPSWKWKVAVASQAWKLCFKISDWSYFLRWEHEGAKSHFGHFHSEKVFWDVEIHWGWGTGGTKRGQTWPDILPTRSLRDLRLRGRIPLSDFYSSSTYRHWNFTESPDYLRDLALMIYVEGSCWCLLMPVDAMTLCLPYAIHSKEHWTRFTSQFHIDLLDGWPSSKFGQKIEVFNGSESPLFAKLGCVQHHHIFYWCV